MPAVIPTFLLLGLLTLAAAFARAAPSAAELALQENRMRAELVASGTNVARLFALADVCHELGVTGDKQAVTRAEGYLRLLLALSPTNGPAVALLGSVFTMKGRDAFWPTTQLKLVREGNALMDQGVGFAPDDIQTRCIRALNNAHMPDFLGRVDLVRADLAWLWERIDREAARFTPTARQKTALHWGRQLLRLGKPEDAREVWTRGAMFPPENEVTRELLAEIAKLR
ncbi:MAG: hypothetical protein IT580_16730 [Verrucomicrobiales bacterium]|nr:hypothetical protein [Verrucomicrobiales bacterium]